MYRNNKESIESYVTFNVNHIPLIYILFIYTHANVAYLH